MDFIGNTDLFFLFPVRIPGSSLMRAFLPKVSIHKQGMLNNDSQNNNN